MTREDGAVLRIVTGCGTDGEAQVLFEGGPPVEVEDRLMHVAELWATDSTPPEINDKADAAAREWRFEPSPGGSIFRVVTFQPGATSGLHSTETLDYLTVLSGEIVLIVGDREIVLRGGDVVVQKCTLHNWVNRSGQPCVMVGVLLAASASG
ncbi:MAG TPA: cupin domain-containing protein [Acidimicrobiales bacterium]|nr:cupin domain-containing protein [Acidimicrobiales bacterium]